MAELICKTCKCEKTNSNKNWQDSVFWNHSRFNKKPVGLQSSTMKYYLEGAVDKTNSENMYTFIIYHNVGIATTVALLEIHIYVLYHGYHEKMLTSDYIPQCIRIVANPSRIPHTDVLLHPLCQICRESDNLKILTKLPKFEKKGYERIRPEELTRII